jgi:hypothetical protein
MCPRIGLAADPLAGISSTTAFSKARLTASPQGAPPVPTPGSTVKAATDARQGVGFTAGLVSGLGFAYRRNFANNFGMQIGGSGWASRDESFLSLGGEAIRTISRSDRTRLYWMAGTSVFRSTGPYYNYNDCYPVTPAAPVCVPSQTDRTTGSLNFGAGIGLEFTGRRVGGSLEVPVSLMLDIEEGHRFERKGIYPIPGVSLIYYF